MPSIASSVRLALTIISVVTWTVFSTGCNRDSHPTSKPKVVIGYLPIAAGLPLFVAIEKGYFVNEGFDVELVRFASSNELGTAATSGQVDALMPFALNAGFDIGIVSGKRHRLIGYNIYSDKKPHVVDYLLAGKSSGIKKLGDLRGRRIAGFPGSVTKIFVENILQKEGVQPKDYTYTELAPKDWLIALQSGSVDAASVMEPQASLILSAGAAYVVVEGFFAKLMPDVPLSGHWLSAKFVETQQPEKIVSFVRVFDEAVDFIRKHPDEAKQFYVKYLGMDPNALENIQLNDWKKLSEMNVSRVQAFADLLGSNKAIQERVDVQQYIWEHQ